MKKQKGAALIVVMSLLAISLMIGLMSMQSSQVDERLAGNYKAAAEAQMAAEFGAAYGMEMIRGTPDYFEEQHDSDEACEDFAREGLSEQERRSLDGDVEWYEVGGVDAEIIGCQDNQLVPDLYLSWGQVRDGGGAIIAENFVAFGYSGGASNNLPPLSSPLVCLLSEDCGWDDADVSDYFDDRPHPEPDEFDCSGDGCRADPEDDAEPMGKVEYNPDAKSEWEDFVSDLDFHEVIAGGGGASLSQGERGDYRNIEVVPGSGNNRVTSGGSVNTSGIIVIRSGAEFRGQGTGHHEGLIIVEAGGSLSLDNNYNVYGAVVALGNVTLNVGSGGQGGVRYHPKPLGKGSGNLIWDIL